MPSYSTSLKLELMDKGTNSNSWGTVTNTNLGTALEQAIVGRADISMSSTTITLSLTNSNAAQDARAIYLNLTGSPGGAAELRVPAVQKPYIVKNGSDQQVTVKVAGLTGVVVPVGKTVLVYNNGTDVVTAVDYIPSLTLGAALPVASGGTGITAFGTGVATALGQNVTGSGGIALATSPALTGSPTAPTQTSGTNDTTLATTAFVAAAISTGLLTNVYPVGSIYINATNATNPATLLGFGTWVAFGAGRVPVGFNASDPLFDSAEETGGSKDAVVVSHTHTYTSTEAAGPNPSTNKYISSGVSTVYNTGVSTSPAINFSIDSTGVSGTNANLQPYITVYMWKRTA